MCPHVFFPPHDLLPATQMGRVNLSELRCKLWHYWE